MTKTYIVVASPISYSPMIRAEVGTWEEARFLRSVLRETGGYSAVTITRREVSVKETELDPDQTRFPRRS